MFQNISFQSWLLAFFVYLLLLTLFSPLASFVFYLNQSQKSDAWQLSFSYLWGKLIMCTNQWKTEF